MDGFLFEKPGLLTATEERKRKGWHQRMRERERVEGVCKMSQLVSS